MASEEYTPSGGGTSAALGARPSRNSQLDGALLVDGAPRMDDTPRMDGTPRNIVSANPLPQVSDVQVVVR